ncbi:hypothetical protein COBT_003627, partial [Conglomerata obtusa]
NIVINENVLTNAYIKKFGLVMIVIVDQNFRNIKSNLSGLKWVPDLILITAKEIILKLDSYLRHEKLLFFINIFYNKK